MVMKEFDNANIRDGLKKRLVDAISEAGLKETFYSEEMRIEGTLCFISDRNSFIVFQITELIGCKTTDSTVFQKPLSSAESEPMTNRSDNNQDSYEGGSQRWLDHAEHSQIETDINGCLMEFSNNTISQNSVIDENCSYNSRNLLSPEDVATTQQIDNPQSFNTSKTNSKKSTPNRPMTRHRRRMIYNNSCNNDNSDVSNGNAGDLLQNIKQEVADFGFEDTIAVDASGSGENSIGLLKMPDGVDLADIESGVGVKNVGKTYRSRRGVNSTAFSGRFYEEIYVRTPHGLYRYMCRLCNSMFKIRNGLYEHLNGHFGRRPHACRQCDARFAHHSSLHNHVRNKHSLQTEEEKQAALRHCCPTCGRRFRYPSELERHKAVHEEFPVNPPTGFGHNLLADAAVVDVNQQLQASINSTVGSQQDVTNQFEFQILDHLASLESLQNGEMARVNIRAS